MSARIQTFTNPIPAVPGRATVTFYVNVFQDSDGGIEQGSRTFRSKENAVRKGLAAESAYLAYLDTVEFTVEAEV